MTIKKLSIISIFLFCTFFLTAQKERVIILKCNDCAKKEKIQLIGFSDSSTIENKLVNILTNYYFKGYAEASIDSFNLKENSAFLKIGKKYFWKHLLIIDTETNDSIEYRKIRKAIFSFPQINSLFKKQIKALENSGYPMASIVFVKLETSDNGISGIAKIERNKFYSIDSIINKGDLKISPHFLKHYTDLYPGMIYNEKLIINLKKRSEELLFLEEAKPYELIFKENKVDLYTYYNKKKANQFYGILGLVPNNETTGKLMLTGEADLFLLNSFHQGEKINFNWSKPENGSQKLLMGLDYPFINKFPIGIKINFDLYKKDSSYLNVSGIYGLKFKLKGKNFVHGFVKKQTGSIISTVNMENITVLPDFIDYNSSLFGLGFEGDNLDYYYNPKKGFKARFSIAGGSKKIKKNSAIPQNLYSAIKMNSSSLELILDFAYFLPLSKMSTIKFSPKIGIKSNEVLFDNELFRLGGLKNLRGFDEESIYASAFASLTIEPRYVFEKNSAFYIFADFAYLEKNTANSKFNDTPIGLGLGTDFETKSGIFSISYAVGKQQTNPFMLKTAKIHFGYINRF
ncbi:MAG: BamA/TamA family outer membrane protein [Bacteroidales bacterium]|nr:BamA/TamA family outer membrane protein [Bacteroidales bacterium]